MIRVHRNFNVLSRKHVDEIKPWIQPRISAIRVISSWASVIVNNAVNTGIQVRPMITKGILHYKTIRKLLNVFANFGNTGGINDIEYFSLNTTQGSLHPVITLNFLNVLNLVINDIDSNIDFILGAQPKDLLRKDIQIKTIYRRINKNERKTINTCIMFIFDYDSWSGNSYDKWGPIHLAEMLNIRTCPYCNRQYTSTIHEGRNGVKIRPVFDHFMPKSARPLLAMSFWNLIPSCHTCNSILKGDKYFHPVKHLHPYENGFSSDRIFVIEGIDNSYKVIDLAKTENDLRIRLQSSLPDTDNKIQRCHRHEKVFKIEQIYNHVHRDVAAEIWFKTKAYTDKSLDDLSVLGVPVSRADASRIILGNYLNESDWEKRPLAKMTHDIAKDLGWTFK